MIAQIEFTRAYAWPKQEAIFAEGLTVNLDPEITVLVGDQGSGKSTLIDLVRSWFEQFENLRFEQERLFGIGSTRAGNFITCHTDLPPENYRVIAVDFERDTSREKAGIGLSAGKHLDTLMHFMQASKASHGESNKLALNMALQSLMREYQKEGKIVQPTLILLDEPDSALSIASVVTLHMTLRALVKLGCQIIVSAHNPFFLGCFERVFFLEQKKWIDYQVYLLKQILKPGLGPSDLFMTHYQSVDDAIKPILRAPKTKQEPENPDD